MATILGTQRRPDRQGARPGPLPRPAIWLICPAMAKPAKRRVPGGRVTPRGTTPASNRPLPSTRYTPPVPREVKVSPMWVPVLMFALLGLGLVLIFLNYLDLLPGGTSNAYLGAGLASICAGIIVATQLH
jgi:Cell division protein CrgA